jgi:hypothetical protein
LTGLRPVVHKRKAVALATTVVTATRVGHENRAAFALEVAVPDPRLITWTRPGRKVTAVIFEFFGAKAELRMLKASPDGANKSNQT